MSTAVRRLAAAVIAVGCATTAVDHAAYDAEEQIRGVVDMAIRPLMVKHRIAGMAVGITVAGKQYVFSYGVASTETRRPVTRDTLFENGSGTKTLTATLAS